MNTPGSNGRTVLITGATGYLGSHVLKSLEGKGFRFVILKRSFSNTTRVDRENSNYFFYDIDRVGIEDAFKSHEIDAIVHCATNYGRKETDPLETVQSNLLLPLQLLELGRMHGVQSFVNTDTILDKGVNRYSLSKSQFKDWLLEYAGDLTCCNVALEHFYGPGDDGTKFVSYIIRAFLRDEPSISLTPGLQKRDFIYIDDVVSAMALIVEQSLRMPKGFHKFEIGTGDPVSIRSFVELIKKLASNHVTETRFGDLPYRVNEVMERLTDISAIKQLGWKCKYNLEQGLSMTVKAEREAKEA